MPKVIVVDIDSDGSVQINAEGFKGTECAKATEQLELILGGGQRPKKDKKPEYYMPSGSAIRSTLKF